MRTLLQHLRFSGLLWWIPPLMALDLATLFLRSNYWVGIWPESGAAAQVPAFLLGIGACGTSAWISGARSRNGIDEQLAATPLPSAKIDMYRLGSVLVAFTLPYLCGVVAAWAATWPTNPPGISMFFQYVLLGESLILLSCAWGWLLGKLLTGRFAAIAAILSWIIVTMAFGSEAGLSVVTGPPSKEIDSTALSLRWGAMVVLIAAMLFLPSRISIRKLPSHSASLVNVAAGIGVIAAISGTSIVAERVPPSSLPCTEGPVEMCYWPEHEKYRQLMHSIGERAAALPEGFSIPRRIYEFGTQRQTFRMNGMVHEQASGDFSVVEGSRWSLSKDLSVAITEKTFPSCDWDAARAANDSTADTIEHWVEIYLAGGGNPDYRLAGVDDGFIKAREESSLAAEQKTEREQFAWVQKKMEYFNGRYCKR